MATRSHKKQVLPIANQIIPISNDTTFHANFNKDLNGRTLDKIVYPFGYTSSLNFNGSSDYVTIGDRPELSFNNIFTIEFWMKAADLPSPIGVLGKRGAPWEYSVYGGNGTMGFTAWNPGGSVAYTITNVPYDTNWNHYAWVTDGTSAYVYRNGIQVGTATKTAQAMGDTTVPFEIGRGGDGGSTRYMKGSLSDVRVWNVARTPEQIQSHMNTPVDGKPGLVGYWKLNEGSGPLISDFSPIGNDGLYVGTPKWTEGRTIVTKRTEGKFGSAIAVERSTTNLVPDSLIQGAIGTTSNSSSTTWDIVKYGTGTPNPSYSVTNGTLYVSGSHVAVGDLRVYSPSITFDKANDFVFQMKLKYTKGQLGSLVLFGPVVDDLNNMNMILPRTSKIELKDGWALHTYKVPAGTLKGSGDVGRFALFHNWANAEDLEFYTKEWQMEKTVLAPSSFTPSQRSSGFLAYPIQVINPDQGTISFWLNAESTSSDNPVFSTGSDGQPGDFDFLISESRDPYVRGYGENAQSVQIRPKFNAFGQWNHVVVTWERGKYLRCYVNGSLSAESLSSVDWGTPMKANASAFYVGCGMRVNPSFVIDELRIDKTVASESEIVAWYVGGPHYNSYHMGNLSY